MARRDSDLCVIGGGSGGVRAARVAAALGARVVLVEKGELGGTCVNVGCIPKKLLWYAAELSRDLEEAPGYGFRLGPAQFDWSALIAGKDAEIRRLNGVYQRLLRDAGVEVVSGTASLADRHRVEVQGRLLVAEHVLLATGGRPYVPACPGAQHASTSDDAFAWKTLPRSLVIVGGGYIAVEFASILNALGSQVTLVHRGDQVLGDFDPDVRTHVARELVGAGIELCLGLQVAALGMEAGQKSVTLGDGRVLYAEEVLFATGRLPNTSGLGLASAGVQLGGRGEVIVDDYGKSSVDTIYAVGDCTDRINLTPVAIAEGQAVARTLFGGRPVLADRDCVPTAVFGHPPVGAVGLSEPEAQSRRHAVEIYRSVFTPLKHTLGGREEKAMMKLVVDRDTQRLLGVHVVAPDAGEIVQGFAVALKSGVTKQQLDDTIGIHPTAAEELVTMREPVRSSPAF